MLFLFTTVLITLVIFGSQLLVPTVSAWPSLQSSNTASPGNSTCSGCHNGATASPTGSAAITGFPSAYTPGTPIPLTVTVNDTTHPRWGYILTARLATSVSTQEGTFASTDGKSVTSGLDIKATDSSVTLPTSTWSITWTPPSSNVGTVNFYLEGVAGPVGQAVVYQSMHPLAAAVSANVAPKISTNPANQSVTSGNNASFMANASGTPPPTVQWQVSTDNGVTFTNVGGATSATLTLTAVTAAQSGNQYRAVFTNIAGNATTSAATLTVSTTSSNVAPKISTNPANQSVTSGNNASFMASASGTPPPTVQWQVSTDNGVTFTNVGGAISATLTLTAVTAAQSGNQYRAVFTNIAGNATTSVATLTVSTTSSNVAPKISTNPANQSVASGSNASFMASASGTPPPTVQWQVSTDGGTTFSNVGGATSGTLALTAVTAAQNGNKYRAVFTNSAGSATTSAATLTVSTTSSNVAPAITSANSTTFTMGTTGTFMMTATGTPAPTRGEMGTLPAGVTFNAATGMLSGMPTASGTFPITFTATNGVNPNASQNFMLTVNTAPTGGTGGGSTSSSVMAQSFVHDPTRAGDVAASWVDYLGASPHNASDPLNRGLVLSKGSTAGTDAMAGATIQNVTGMSLTELGFDFQAGVLCTNDSPHFVVRTTNGVTHTLGGCTAAASQSSPAMGWMRLRFDPKSATPAITSTDHVQSISIVLDKGSNQPGSTPTQNAAGSIVVIDNIDINGMFTGKSSSSTTSWESRTTRDD
jgi:hypothetical protein